MKQKFASRLYRNSLKLNYQNNFELKVKFWSFLLPARTIKKAVKLCSAGELGLHINRQEYKWLSVLSIEGEIDARDFLILRKMSNLKILDFSNAVIKAYHEHFANEIPWNAFSDNTKIKKIILPDSIESISDLAFYKCKNLQTITLPTHLIKIGYSAFQNCSNLKSIVLPERLTHIGFGAFSGCRSLSKIQINAGRLINLDENASVFHQVCPRNCMLFVRKGFKKDYSTANEWSKFESIVEFRAHND